MRHRPTSPQRGFLLWRFSDAGRRTRGDVPQAAGIRNPTQQATFVARTMAALAYELWEVSHVSKIDMSPAIPPFIALDAWCHLAPGLIFPRRRASLPSLSRSRPNPLISDAP